MENPRTKVRWMKKWLCNGNFIVVEDSVGWLFGWDPNNIL